jgi:hypothetical protein
MRPAIRPAVRPTIGQLANTHPVMPNPVAPTIHNPRQQAPTRFVIKPVASNAGNDDDPANPKDNEMEYEVEFVSEDDEPKEDFESVDGKYKLKLPSDFKKIDHDRLIDLFPKIDLCSKYRLLAIWWANI